MSTRASAKSTPIIRWSKDNFIRRTYYGENLPRPGVCEREPIVSGSFVLTSDGLVEVKGSHDA